ncbi:Golgin subfamily A member 7/ERF4 family-domain-containing protein [Stachybotrys elegans]|uniref:Ras modification protein ERF4 n=1 Tax=Stachybotrys elegans TaxID=80388 RepID=A0A8K0WWS5_9HYPO|nr:Golgin subfamily A member 7/ERF4 family-domain-containing protein [Stachybotrys elegans]
MTTDNEEPAARAYSRDLERGPDALEPRPSNVSIGDGIGSALSSTNSSIMGEDVQGDLGDEWGPQHPCYPHLNPHVPMDSIEYATTRIIRIRRDWLLKGDLAPTFSNLYPEILDPAGLSEQEFRRIIDKLNSELIPVFDPWSLRNIIDGLLGLVTGWVWDDMGMTYIKSRLNNLEKWIDDWNAKMEKTATSEEGVALPKLVSLRRTGYMSVRATSPRSIHAYNFANNITARYSDSRPRDCAGPQHAGGRFSHGLANGARTGSRCLILSVFLFSPLPTLLTTLLSSLLNIPNSTTLLRHILRTTPFYICPSERHGRL